MITIKKEGRKFRPSPYTSCPTNLKFNLPNLGSTKNSVLNVTLDKNNDYFLNMFHSHKKNHTVRQFFLHKCRITLLSGLLSVT